MLECVINLVFGMPERSVGDRQQFLGQRLNALLKLGWFDNLMNEPHGKSFTGGEAST